ncbi:MAG TPA: hypothetical protein VJ718_03195 [Candidatus Binataceae bacterium]|nr:hypothetical protein [Candidatus Binataceae bacterium]
MSQQAINLANLLPFVFIGAYPIFGTSRTRRIAAAFAMIAPRSTAEFPATSNRRDAPFDLIDRQLTPITAGRAHGETTMLAVALADTSEGPRPRTRAKPNRTSFRALIVIARLLGETLVETMSAALTPLIVA